MQKTFKCGFYGGKFLPFHAGHKYCIRVAAQECERLVVIFFSNSEEETEIILRDTQETLDNLNALKTEKNDVSEREMDRLHGVAERAGAIVSDAYAVRKAVTDSMEAS